MCILEARLSSPSQTTVSPVSYVVVLSNIASYTHTHTSLPVRCAVYRTGRGCLLHVTGNARSLARSPQPVRCSWGHRPRPLCHTYGRHISPPRQIPPTSYHMRPSCTIRHTYTVCILQRGVSTYTPAPPCKIRRMYIPRLPTGRGQSTHQVLCLQSHRR